VHRCGRSAKPAFAPSLWLPTIAPCWWRSGCRCFSPPCRTIWPTACLTNRSELTQTEQRQRFAAALRRARLSHLIEALDQRLADLTEVDRKCLSLIRALGSDPPLVCLDELTAGLDDEAQPPLSIIKDERSRRAFLVVTHHQGHARAIADEIVLLAGGSVMEHGPSQSFFAGPRTEAAARFLKTGSCHSWSPDARPKHLAAECQPQPEVPAPSRPTRSDSQGPPEFRWLIEGRLGGVSPASSATSSRILQRCAARARPCW
jgi:atypical dual specificity phosphatase